jgi:hypothetical protein
MRVAFFAALLAFAGLLSASCGVNSGSYMDVCGINSFSDCGDAASFIAISFMFVSAAISLVYMYGKLKQDVAAELWAKDEMFNLIISVFLFVGLIAFFTTSCFVVQQYVGKNPFDAAEGYIDNLLLSSGLNVVRAMYYDSISNQLDATAYYFQSIAPFHGRGSALNAHLRARSSHKEFLIDLYLPIIASLNAQKYLLQSLRWIGAAILLPFAFVMRLFPPTREFGNTMIAIFFAIYIVVPLLYAMSGEAFSQVVGNPRCEYTDQNGYCSVHNFYSLGIDGGDGREAGKYSGHTMKDAILYKIGSTIPQAVFIPNLVIVIAVTCAMSISKALRAVAV